MVHIFIEAKRLETPEGVFLQALIHKYIPDAVPYTIYAVDGWSNLRQPANVMNMQLNTQDGGRNLIVFDADSSATGGGFENRLSSLKEQLSDNGILADIFLWPDNHSDGTVENLMLDIARRDLHSLFFDCFEDYEACLSSARRTDGSSLYHCPDLKSKAFTFISSMSLSNTQRKHLGRGNWLFEKAEYWDLESERVEPIVTFLKERLDKNL